MSIQDKISNEQIDKKLESFVEVVLQKMIDLHQEIKTLKRKIHEQDIVTGKQIGRAHV